MMHAETATALRLRCLLPALPGAPLQAPPDPAVLALAPGDAADFATLAEALAAAADHAAELSADGVAH